MLRSFALFALVLLSLTPAGAIAQQDTPPAKAPKKTAPFRWVSPLAPAAEEKQALPPTVKHATFKSPSMGIDVGYYLYLPLGYNAWDLAKAFAERKDRPALSILLWDGTECFNFEFNGKYSAYLKELGLPHQFLVIPGVGHTATGSYEKTARTS